MIIEGENGAGGIEPLKGSHESFINLSEVSSFLHGDNSELIFFIDPSEERFIIVVENTSVVWPVPVKVASFKESVSFFEQEMVIN